LCVLVRWLLNILVAGLALLGSDWLWLHILWLHGLLLLGHILGLNIGWSGLGLLLHISWGLGLGLGLLWLHIVLWLLLLLSVAVGWLGSWLLIYHLVLGLLGGSWLHSLSLLLLNLDFAGDSNWVMAEASRVHNSQFVKGWIITLAQAVEIVRDPANFVIVGSPVVVSLLSLPAVCIVVELADIVERELI